MQACTYIDVPERERPRKRWIAKERERERERNRGRSGYMIEGRRQKCCKRWWSAKPITLSQIWLPPSLVPARGSFAIIGRFVRYTASCRCVRMYVSLRMCLSPARLTRRCRTDDRLENRIRHCWRFVSTIDFRLVPSADRRGTIHGDHPSKRRSLNENCQREKGASLDFSPDDAY